MSDIKTILVQYIEDAREALCKAIKCDYHCEKCKFSPTIDNNGFIEWLKEKGLDVQ